MISVAAFGQSFTTAQYLSDLQKTGKEPIAFIHEQLNRYDLIIFDDGLHPAYEPFVFYKELIKNPLTAGKIDYIFLEVISTTAQPLIDSFLHAPTNDSSILMKAFQDDYTGMGWNLQTYMDLFNTVRQYNRGKTLNNQIKIIGVNPPIYWDAIHSWKDYEMFQSSLKSRDYFMYLEITEAMNDFKEGKKGLFLTNTRHAYKRIKNATGKMYWNTGSFFHHWNRSKTFSVRLHNATLSVQSVKRSSTNQRKTTDGLNETVFKWIRMDQGKWDSAFAHNGNKPVAVDLNKTVFGKTKYVGNHMLNVDASASMRDAYDAVIFLAPLTGLHFSAQFNFIYTQDFKKELGRRLHILQGEGLNQYFKNNNAANFDEFYEKSFRSKPIRPNSFIKD
jgi:hypothetical protein